MDSYSTDLNSGLACDYPRVTVDVTLPQGHSGQCLTAMGRITATPDQWIPSDPAANDGSEVIRGFSAKDFDTTVDGVNQAITLPVHKTGRFIKSKVDFGSHTVDQALLDQLEAADFYFEEFGGAS